MGAYLIVPESRTPCLVHVAGEKLMQGYTRSYRRTTSLGSRLRSGMMGRCRGSRVRGVRKRCLKRG
jgi:hypothetical protein